MANRSLTVRRFAVGALVLVAVIGAACSQTADFPEAGSPVSNIPWPDYELLRYDISDQTDEILGTVDFEVERQGDEFQMRVLFVLVEDDVRDEAILYVEAATLKPLRYSRLATDFDSRVEIEGVYGIDENGEAIVDTVVIEDGEREEQRVETGEFAFDTDSSAWLWRSIAFAQDYAVSYRSVNVPQQRSQLVRLRVLGQDLLRTPAGDFLSWQVEARPGLDRQNIWFAVDAPHYLVRWDLPPRTYLLREVVTEKAAETAP